jgi:hypothetical protein
MYLQIPVFSFRKGEEITGVIFRRLYVATVEKRV